MTSPSHSNRANLVLGLIFIGLILIELRLFYWQIIKSNSLKTQAKQQITTETKAKGHRGQILSKNKHLLVGNQSAYQISINQDNWDQSLAELAAQLTQIILDEGLNQIKQEPEKIETDILKTLNRAGKWVDFPDYLVNIEAKEKIKKLDSDALYLKPKMTRYYPEASMAAHLTGFVGKNQQGQDTGYFGVEGALDKELQGRAQKKSFFKDALGFTLAGQKLNLNNLDGRDVILTIERDIQNIAETQLKQGINQYQAKRGEIIILDPQTGQIKALATWPHYDQAHYYLYENKDFKNPTLADLFEPGSTFKILTVAAGLDAGIINPDTACTKCSGPRKIGGYTIRTWNDQYNPGITMTEALAKSDNTAMIFVAQKLGANRFGQYMKDFGIGQNLDLDLQEDSDTPFPKKLGPAELATTSFGQGVSLNSFQLIRAAAAIANQGQMMKPTIVDSVYDPQTGKTIKYQPQEIRQVISTETATKVTKMMVKAAQKGEAQWIGKDYLVAGKTGTSQIPSPDGGYREEATIASFVGFAPPDDPEFIMLVKLVEPQSSPWAAETAAPLWFQTAEKLFLLLNIQQNDN